MMESDQWLSMGSLSQALWRFIFTKTGFSLFFAASCAAGYSNFNKFPYTWLWIFSPVAILPMFFVLFVLVLAAALGDVVAIWLFKKLVKNPNTANFWHRLLYFLLSCIGFIIAGLFIGFGDTYPVGSASL